MFFKPQLFDFPEDKMAFINPEHTFLVGSGLKVSPILYENSQTTESYFPNTDWFCLPSGKKQYTYDPTRTQGKSFVFESPIDSGIIHVHMRGGYIIPYQDVLSDPIVQTTEDLFTRHMNLYVAPKSNTDMIRAQGTIYYDYDELDPIAKENYNLITIQYIRKYKEAVPYSYLKFDMENEGFDYDQQGAVDQFLENVLIFDSAAFNDCAFACVYNAQKKLMKKFLAEMQENNVLHLFPQREERLKMSEAKFISWQKEEECNEDFVE